MHLSRFPRLRFAHLSTPLEPMPRLSKLLGGPNLWVKRDDCTGLAGGGNKTRKLEFLMADALAQGADTIITQGATQSNHARQTAAIATKLGLEMHILLEDRTGYEDTDYNYNGNVLLNQMFGAHLTKFPAGTDMNQSMADLAAELSTAGRKPYVIPGGGSNPIGALGYANCAQEIAEQTRDSGQHFDWLVMGTGSTGTQAGLVAGFHTIGHDLPVMGVSVRQPRERQINAVHGLTQRTLEKLGAPGIAPSKILVDDGYVGEGYGLPADSTMEAIHLTARQEGILLDPVYSAKGMAGLIGMVRQGFFKPQDSVLFLHTGGSVALFAYQEQLRATIQ